MAALHLAAQTGDVDRLDVVRHLVDIGADKAATTTYGETPMG